MLENKQKTENTGGKYLPKRKKRKKWLIPVVVVAVVAVAVILGAVFGGKEQQAILNLTDTTVLSYQDMEDTISVSGTVESASTTTIYSTMAYPVMAVHVEVGDYVEEGQLLAELDGKTLQNQITTQEIGLETAERTSGMQVQTAQNNYQNFKEGLDQGLNQTLNGAKTQVETAYDNYIRARNTYERYAESLNVGENTTIIGAESALRSARTAYETAQDNLPLAMDALESAEKAEADAKAAVDEAWPEYDAAKKARDDKQQEVDALNTELEALKQNPEADQAVIDNLEDQLEALNEELSQLKEEFAPLDLEMNGAFGMGGLQTTYDQAVSAREQAETAVKNAWKTLDNAAAAYESQQATYNATLTTVDNTLADYQTAVDTAWKTYQNALTTLASTEKTVGEQLESYANSVASAQIGAENATGKESLRQMQETLDDTRITAPCSGTVTAVYAEVGGAGSGLLFIIEDVDNLVIATSVKGYDMGTVQEGMRVVIRSDATGDAEIDGVVTSIAPTANKTTGTAMAAASTDPIFAAEVEVTSQNTGLRIGMEAELDYILAEEEHVLAVPYDAVYTNEAGQTCILAAIPLGEEKYEIRQLPVTTGLDDDLDMVVTGDGIEEGLRVIHDPASYLELVGQTVIGITPDLHGMEAIVGGMMG